MNNSFIIKKHISVVLTSDFYIHAVFNLGHSEIFHWLLWPSVSD
jgi:hypothetical protein